MGYQQRYMAAAPDQLVIQVIQDPEVLPPHRSKDGMNIWGVRERGGLKTVRNHYCLCQIWIWKHSSFRSMANQSPALMACIHPGDCQHCASRGPKTCRSANG